MALGRTIARWLFLPVWTAAPPKREEWTCPACGRTVWRTNPAWKGIWFVPSELELTGRCARQHGAHGRRGGELPADDGGAVWAPAVDVAEVAALGGRVPVVRLDGGRVVALLPPAGLLLSPVGDGLEVEVLDDLAPSDLVGGDGGHLRGRPVGRIDVTALDDEGVDAAALAPLLAAAR